MFPPEIGQKAPGCLALAILLLAAVLLHNHLRAERDYFPLVGMNDGRPQHLLVVFHLPVTLALLEAVWRAHLLRGVDTGAVQGQQIVAVQRASKFKCLRWLILS